MFYLLAYAPELNPVKTMWPHLKRGLGNLDPCTLDDLVAVIRSRLKQMQYRAPAFWTPSLRTPT
ncbi:hypothetical protein [Microtetraspora malaysiensis]|uniref:hypothetical protein n=1 Tax=Microtetraspora malaysiensis TaxID=161358 RepID=UPI003D91D9FF